MSAVKVGVFFGGMPIENDRKTLRENPPHVVVGTPGRILALIRGRELSLKNVKHFVLDECDKMLEQLDMRRDVQDIFRSTPHEKQVSYKNYFKFCIFIKNQFFKTVYFYFLGYDVFRHPLQRNSTSLQEIHERPYGSLRRR